MDFSFWGSSGNPIVKAGENMEAYASGKMSSEEFFGLPGASKEPTASGLAQGDYHNSDYWLQTLYNRAQNGDESAIEKLYNYYTSEQSAKTARDWTAQREDTTYQRLVADLKKAGISPYIMSGATPAVSSSTGNTYSGSQMTSKYNNERNQKSDIISKIIGVLGTALMAAAIGSKR